MKKELNIHIKIKFALFLIIFVGTISIAAELPIPEQLRCIILLDQNDFEENVGRSGRFYLMSKLQAAIEEQSTPILVNASLWNSFIERRAYFSLGLSNNDSEKKLIFSTYTSINDRINYWFEHYNTKTDDRIHIKELVTRHINDEFYKDNSKLISDDQYQIFLNYITNFDLSDWDIYKNEGGFFLLIPHRYKNNLGSSESDWNTKLGFKLSTLEKVAYPDQPGNLYFEAYPEHQKSISQNLSDFFILKSDSARQDCSYLWNIVLSGHGGWNYKETCSNENINCQGEAIICDLSVQEFKSVLDFFNDEINTHSFFYATCYGGGNHTILPFQETQNKLYSFAIISGCLTDCYSYCKWDNQLPSNMKKYLDSSDIIFNAQEQKWQLRINSPYKWKEFFSGISRINFTSGCLDSLEQCLDNISYCTVENMSLIRLPNSLHFYPIYSGKFAKMSEDLMPFNDENKTFLPGVQFILLECNKIDHEICFNNDNYRDLHFLSFRPGNAIHYIKKISSTFFLDLTNLFWQLSGQLYDKFFLIEELLCPASSDFKEMFSNIPIEDELSLRNILVFAHKDHLIRIFCTINNEAVMIVANKPNCFSYKTTTQVVSVLDNNSRLKYEKKYEAIKRSLLN